MSTEIIKDASEEKNLTEKKTLKFKIPKELVKIPSKGLVYDKKFLIGEEIEMRYMTAADEDTLMSPSLGAKGLWLTRLLQNCINQKNFNVDDLLEGDRNRLLFWLRQSAYGSSYSLEITCPECRKKYQNDFKLNQLKMKTLDINPAQEGKNEFEFTLPQSGMKVIFAFMTGKMSADLAKEIDGQLKSSNPNESIITSRLRKQIVKIDDVDDVKEIADFINDGMLAADSLALRTYIDDNRPDIDLTQDATCSHCGSTNNFEIPIELQFFWPQSKR